MAPKNKFTRAEMTAAALDVIRAGGREALTAKSLAEKLKISTQPVFTCYGTMESLHDAVYAAAEDVYNTYADAGLRESIPFFGMGMSYIRFAREEPELYRLLFLTPAREGKGAWDAMRASRVRVLPALQEIYRMTAPEAERYFRDLWLVVHSLATLIVTGACSYTEEEIGHILTGYSVSVCKAIKEIPGFTDDTYARDEVFRALIAEGGEG